MGKTVKPVPEGMSDQYRKIAALLGTLNPELWVLTAGHPQRSGGLIATFVAPASIVYEQPRMLIGIARHHYTWAIIEQTGHFALHLLNEDQIEWIERFGTGSGRDKKKFDGLDV